MPRHYYHREWHRRVARWQDYLDATDPDAYLTPGVARPHYLDVFDVKAFDRAVDAGESSDETWRTWMYPSRIQRFRRETPASYQERVALAYHMGLGRMICDTYAAHVSAQPATYPDGRATDPILSAFDQDVTLTGVALADYEREAGFWSQIYGCVHALVEMPAPGELAGDLADGGTSLEAAARVRPISYLVSPIDLVAWEVDTRGILTRVVIRESFQPLWEWGREQPPLEVRLKILDASSWSVYRQRHPRQGGELRDGDEMDLIGEGAHLAGVVPLVTRYCWDDSTVLDPIGRGRMEVLEPIDRELLNLLSERREWVRDACFTMRALPRSMFSRGMRVGNAWAVPLEAGDPPPLLLESSGAPFDRISQAIEEAIHRARLVSGLSRGAAEQSASERSGKALAFEMHDKVAQLRHMVAERERWEQSLVDMVWRVRHGRPIDPALGGMSVSRDFAGDALELELTRVLELVKVVGLPPPAVTAALHSLGQTVISEYATAETEPALAVAMEAWLEAQTQAPEEAVPEVPAEADAEEAVQDEAMNGAQVQALQSLVQAVAQGQMPAVSAVELIGVAFPRVPRDVALRMVGAAEGFEPVLPPPIAQRPVDEVDDDDSAA